MPIPYLAQARYALSVGSPVGSSLNAKQGQLYANLRKEVTMHLRKMDHTALIVRELERSRWFYGEVLGLQEVPRPSNFTFGGSWFQGPGFQIHLILASDTSAPAGFAEVAEKDVRIGRAHHIAF